MSGIPYYARVRELENGVRGGYKSVRVCGVGISSTRLSRRYLEMFDSAVAYVQGATGLVPEQTMDGDALFSTDASKNKTLRIAEEDGEAWASLYVSEASIAGLDINQEKLWLVVTNEDGAYSCVRMSHMITYDGHVSFCVELASAPRWAMEATLALLVDAFMRD